MENKRIKTVYFDSGGGVSGGCTALVSDCKWLLQLGRAEVRWKMVLSLTPLPTSFVVPGASRHGGKVPVSSSSFLPSFPPPFLFTLILSLNTMRLF